MLKLISVINNLIKKRPRTNIKMHWTVIQGLDEQIKGWNKNIQS